MTIINKVKRYCSCPDNNKNVNGKNITIAQPRQINSNKLYQSKYADTNTKNPARFLNNASIINDKHMYMSNRVINTFNILNNKYTPGKYGKQLSIENNVGQMDRLLRLKAMAMKR